MRLQNKVIIVTGSCTGIGRAIAERSVAEGARVVIHGLEKELGQAVVAELGKDKAVLHIEDLTLDGAPQRLVDVPPKSPPPPFIGWRMKPAPSAGRSWIWNTTPSSAAIRQRIRPPCRRPPSSRAALASFVIRHSSFSPNAQTRRLPKSLHASPLQGR